MDLSLIILHLFCPSFHSLFHCCCVFILPTLHRLKHRESSGTFDPCLSHHERSASDISEEIQTDVCLKGTSVQSYPHVKLGAKYNETQWRLERAKENPFFMLSLGFMSVRSSLSRQLYTNFLSKGLVSWTLAPDNVQREQVWVLCEWLLAQYANTASSHLKARRWEVFGKGRNEVFSIALTTLRTVEANDDSWDNISTFYSKVRIKKWFSDRKHPYNWLLKPDPELIIHLIRSSVHVLIIISIGHNNHQSCSGDLGTRVLHGYIFLKTMPTPPTKF